VTPLSWECCGHWASEVLALSKRLHEEGDRLITGGGELVVIVEAGNVVSPPTLDSFPPTFGPAALTGATTPPERRVEVDLNGDGLVDGYVLLTSRPPAMLPGAGFDHSVG